MNQTMDEKDFIRLAETTLAEIESAVENVDELDFELKPGGILELELDNGSKIIINQHRIAQEIWVAARSGGFHFRWNATQATWHDTRDGTELKQKITALLKEQGGIALRWD